MISRGRKVGLVFGVLGMLVGIGAPLYMVWYVAAPSAKDPLRVRLDKKGPYLILATENAGRNYVKAIAKAQELHPGAGYATFKPGDLDGAHKALQQHRPRYALVFIEPQELDLNFAWQWLALITQLDDDPLVDVRTGFITGATPDDAAAFMERIAGAVGGRVTLPGLFIDNFGPNLQADKAAFLSSPGNFMIPVLEKRFGLMSVSHGIEAFTDQRLDSMKGAGLVHFGGHGHPDRIDDGLRGTQAARLVLSPCVVFNGACYTGVTGRWYEQNTPDGKLAEKTVAAADSFCLNLLRNQAIAYLAAVHPDHGVPVYQEMEFLAYSGASLGDVIKHTHDGVILGAGGRLPAFENFAAGMPTPRWTPADVMLKGTAARVLFGDPAMIVADAFTAPPFEIIQKEDGGSLRITAKLANPALKNTLTDTYNQEMSRVNNLFNDRALIVADLPAGWTGVGKVEVVAVKAGAAEIKHRLVGYAMEHDGDGRRLLVQVDVPSDNYMQSAFRVEGATVGLRVTR